MLAIVFWRTYGMARSGKAIGPQCGCRTAVEPQASAPDSEIVTQTSPYKYG